MEQLFSQLEWHHLVQFLGLVASFILTQGGIVALIDRLKAYFNISGRHTNLLVVTVVALWTLVNLITQGLITPEALNGANIAATFLFVLERTQAEYLRIRKLQAGTPVEAQEQLPE